MEVAEIRGPARATRNAEPMPPDVATETQEPVDSAPEPAPAPDPEAPVETTTTPAPRAESERPARRGGFFPLFLGGVAAALIGFALAHYAVPEGWPRPEEPDPELSARLSTIENGLETVTRRVGELAGRLDDVSADVASAETVSAIEEDIEAMRAEITAIDERVAGLSTGTAPTAEMPDFTGAFNDQMASFQEEIDRVTRAAEAEVEAARAEAEATREAAETAERQAELRTALAEIEVALDTGAPFADRLSDLEGLDIPGVLAGAAEEGLTPLAELQRTFPEAARSALRAAPREPDTAADLVERFTAFLRAQTNARSLEPRDGEDADAVLSRAEAALRSGDLEGAVAELEGLAEAPKAALGDWLAAAENRRGAERAVAELSQDIEAM